jgi:hypothetical protein
MEVYITNFFKWLGDNLIPVILFVAIFIKVSPININLIEVLQGMFFKPVKDDIEELKEEFKVELGGVKDQLNEFSKQLEKVEESSDKNAISTKRWDIIEFSNSIDNGILHTRGEYINIKEEIAEYHTLIDKHSLTNGTIGDYEKNINEHYDKNKDSQANLF